MHQPKLFVFLPTGIAKQPQHVCIIAIGVLNYAGEGLDHLVDGHKVETGFRDAPTELIGAATICLEVGPDAGRIAADHQPLAEVLAGDRGQPIGRNAVFGEQPGQPALAIEQHYSAATGMPPFMFNSSQALIITS